MQFLGGRRPERARPNGDALDCDLLAIVDEATHNMPQWVGLSQEDQPVIRHNLVISALAAAAVAMTAFAASPADARDNKKERPYVAQQSSSLDGRATTRARFRGPHGSTPAARTSRTHPCAPNTKSPRLPPHSSLQHNYL